MLRKFIFLLEFAKYAMLKERAWAGTGTRATADCEEPAMYITAEHLRQEVIRPTLSYLGAWSPRMEDQLVDTAVAGPEVGLFAQGPDSLGLYRITAAQHRDIWDRYLAFRPEIASRVRGLASQRAFLSNPDNELRTNLSYSTAIAWLLCERAALRETPPLAADIPAASRPRALSLR